MPLLIAGKARHLIEVSAYRAQHGLPETFGVAHFEPKADDGLGRIDTPAAGEALNALRATVLSAIPAALSIADLLDFLPRLGNLFRVKLYEVNEAVGLRPVEIDFAAAGFDDVGQALAYALVRGRTARATQPPDFAAIYADWLDSTVRISVADHAYPAPDGGVWRVRVLNHAYGRFGLAVWRDSAHADPDAADYVDDSAASCPAEGFMTALLGAVAARIITATG